MTVAVYARKISPEEARENYIMVSKDKLPLFPTKGRTFEIVQGSKRSEAKVESYHCECRGPDSPHEHFFIRWQGLKAGDEIFIKRDENKVGRYKLQVHSVSAQREMCG
jgi:hypothetical protein